MNPKIDTIVMSSDGHHATVSGPIEWENDDTSATFAAAIGQMIRAARSFSRPGRTPRCSRRLTTNAGRRRSAR